MVNVNAFRKKVIGKPCERKAPARFDEGELETGQEFCYCVSSLLYSNKNSRYIKKSLP
jgi:hypothetical protein